MKINKRTAISFGIIFVFLLISLGNAVAVPAEGTRTRILSSEASQKDLDIYGDTIVSADDRNEESQMDYSAPNRNWDIYMYDLPDLQGNSDNRCHVSTAKPCNLSGQDIVAGCTQWKLGYLHVRYFHLIETQITTNKSTQRKPAIYENKIVWQDERNGNQDIYIYDLKTSTENSISVNEANQSDPAISGDKVVWVDELKIDDPEIPADSYLAINNLVCVYDLSISTETQLSSGLRIWSPSNYRKISLYGSRKTLSETTRW